MKKILLIAVFIPTLSLNSFAAELKDCSVHSKFNPKYLACKTANFAKSAKNYQSETWSNENKNKEKKD